MLEAAEVLGVHRDAVKRSLTNAGIPVHRLSGKCFVVRRPDLMAYAEKRKSYQGIGRPRKDPGNPANSERQAELK